MATVSILIPAFKPDHLSKALASARCQTFKDIEILVSDDTVDGTLRDIVTAIDDPRVHYFHHDFQDALRNSHELWTHANGEYVKWLHDDDFLLPTSVEALVGALRKHPGSALAFHERVFIDHDDNVTQIPPPVAQWRRRRGTS
jgi:glycosyltransferase involved in cell wall biosynthesis